MNYAMKIRVSLYIYAFMFTSIFSQYCNIRMKIFDIYYIYRIKLATLINSLLCLYIHTIYHIMAMGITSLSAFFIAFVNLSNLLHWFCFTFYQ